MRDLDEVLRGSFDAHTGEINRAGGVGIGLLERSVRDVRRKRAWRVGATGAVASIAALAIVSVAVAAGGGGGAVAPATSGAVENPNPPVFEDLSSLGACASFIPANSAVLPEGSYVGRAYVDPAAGFVVAVMPDGTVTRVQPGPDGDYPFDFGNGGPQSLMLPTEYPFVMDLMSNSGGGDVWVDSNPVGWGWTAEPLEPAPAGVNVSSLYATFAGTFGFPSQGYSPDAIPDGAIAEVVAHYTDGREVSGALVRDMPGPGQDELDYTGLEAVALRVTLADGQAWEIRADYDPAGIPDLPCQPTPPSRADAPESVEPEPAPAVYADPLSGPESAIFQCDAPLPADLEGVGDVTARLASGDVQLTEWDLFDVGDEGVVVEGSAPVWTVPTANLDWAYIPGWSSSGAGGTPDQMVGRVTYMEVVAVRDGVIVAAASEPAEDWTSGGAGGPFSTSLGVDDATSTEGIVFAFNSARSLLEPCGATTGDLADTQLVVLYGFGTDIDNATYGWTAVAE